MKMVTPQWSVSDGWYLTYRQTGYNLKYIAEQLDQEIICLLQVCCAIQFACVRYIRITHMTSNAYLDFPRVRPYTNSASDILKIFRLLVDFSYSKSQFNILRSSSSSASPHSTVWAGHVSMATAAECVRVCCGRAAPLRPSWREPELLRRVERPRGSLAPCSPWHDSKRVSASV